MIPPGLLFALGLLSTDGWGQIFPKWPPPEKGKLLNIPESFASNVLPSQQATFTPVFPGCPPRTAVSFDPDSYGDFALPWGFSVLMGGDRLSQNGPLQRKALLLNIPKSFASNVLPSQQALFTSVFPGCPPGTAVRFDPDSHGDFALTWDPVHIKVCVCLLRMGSPFPPVLWSSWA